jgi:hypothetical protein
MSFNHVIHDLCLVFIYVPNSGGNEFLEENVRLWVAKIDGLEYLS